MKQEPEAETKLPESVRKGIFGEIYIAEEKAWMESETKYGIRWDKSRDVDVELIRREKEKYRRELQNKYMNRIMEKYGATLEQLHEIKKEGEANNWPKPHIR